jgi:hypothetical protein
MTAYSSSWLGAHQPYRRLRLDIARRRERQYSATPHRVVAVPASGLT